MTDTCSGLHDRYGCRCDRCRAARAHAVRAREVRRAEKDAAELRELFKRYRERNGR